MKKDKEEPASEFSPAQKRIGYIWIFVLIVGFFFIIITREKVSNYHNWGTFFITFSLLGGLVGLVMLNLFGFFLKRIKDKFHFIYFLFFFSFSGSGWILLPALYVNQYKTSKVCGEFWVSKENCFKGLRGKNNRHYYYFLVEIEAGFYEVKCDYSYWKDVKRRQKASLCLHDGNLGYEFITLE